MSNKSQIHWHEGLFLQPHHLQAQQRQLLDAIGDERRLGWSFPYGVVESRMSAEAIENMLVRFDTLKAVMPSGRVVDFPETADLPALDIKQAFAAGSGPITVYLGVPLYYANRANTVSDDSTGGTGGTGGSGGTGTTTTGAVQRDWQVNRVYRLAEIETRDENDGEKPQPMQVRRVNARLILDWDSRVDKDVEAIPVARIVHAAGQGIGLPRLDPAFIPPCLVLTGSATLREMVRDLANQVDASRKELVSQMSRGGFTAEAMRGIQFEQAMRLQILSRAAVRLGPLATTPSIAPVLAYQELRQLLAELTALEPDRDEAGEVSAYDHNRPAIPFGELSKRLRARLKAGVSAPVGSVKFEKISDTLVSAPLTEETLKAAQEFFLAVQSRQDPRAVASLVEDADKFKLIAKSLAAQRIFGVRLAEERHPPVDFPGSSGVTYFRLLRNESAKTWERIVSEHAVAARWLDMESSDFSLTLFWTLSDGGGRP